MTAQEFCYWLQGYMEVEKPKRLNAEQTKLVKAHLQLVFHNVTQERMKQFMDTEGAPSPCWPESLRPALGNGEVYC